MAGLDAPDFSTDSGLRAVTDAEADLARILERYAPPVTFQTFAEFTQVVEESAEPVLGTKTETILPADGLLLMYGDGGAGKTTLSVDAAAHLGSGTPWLDVEVPRPMKFALVENEGPRGKFRQLLAEKAQSWDGEPFAGNLTVLEEPWTKFTLQEPDHRAALAEHIAEYEVDIVFMGPLVTLGTIGGGTPDEISAFEALVVELRSACPRQFALWFVHHENKAGDVSGAWERVPDTLVHVQAQGNGYTRLFWRKARWSSKSHGTSLNLTWEEGRTFAISVKEEVTEEVLAERIVAAVRAHPGEAWTKVRSEIKGASVKERDAMRNQLVKRKVIVNVPKRANGCNLYPADDPSLNRTETGTDWERFAFCTPGEDDRDASVLPYHRTKGTEGTERNDRTGVDEPELAF